MKALVVVPPTPLAARMVEMALKLSRDITLFYSAGAKNPTLEKRVASMGARLAIKSEKGELTTDTLRVVATEDIDLVLAPDRFSQDSKGLSKATEALVNASPVTVMVVK